MASCVALLGACSPIVTTLPAADTLAQVRAGQASALIVNVSGDLQCDFSIIGFYERNETQVHTVTTLRDAGYQSSEPAILALPPGQYAIDSANCMKGGYYPSEYTNLAHWFGFVDIRPGEAVYMGTIDTELVNFRASSAYDSALERFFREAPADTLPTWVLFTIRDNSEVRERISAKYPDLAQRVIFRAPSEYISRDVFLTLLNTAFSNDQDGRPPTFDEATTRFRALLAERRSLTTQ